MDLIVYQMVEFEIVHDTDGDRVVERLARAAVVEDRLAVAKFERTFVAQRLDIFFIFMFFGSEFAVGLLRSLGIDHLFEQFLPFRILKREQIAVHPGHAHAFQDLAFGSAVEHRSHDLPAEFLRGQTQMDFEHLPDVHTGRHAQRIEHDVQRCAVRQERHIFRRQDA